ncbi:uncharacterized protein PRCAT00004790001 [Priceomyces carsonii]|uniref:uncharacterized protein n=1 Tax=Priceomyces carsonii TaxID=28549 RepID=UPI002EDA43C1|nr:unnamed protein product [Priceomyces carsonii]
MEDQTIFDGASSNNSGSSYILGMPPSSMMHGEGLHSMMMMGYKEDEGWALNSGTGGIGATVNGESYNMYEEIFDENNLHDNSEEVMSNWSSSTSSLRNLNYINHTNHTTPDFPNSPKKSVQTNLGPPQAIGFAGYRNQTLQSPQNKQPPQQQQLALRLGNEGRHSSASSLPIDRLNLLSLKQPLNATQISKSPSPEYYGTNRDINQEERTINPRELFTSNKIPVSMSSPSLTTLFRNETRNYRNYTTSKLPSSGVQLHQKKGKVQNSQVQQHLESQPHMTPQTISQKFDFKMNDECFNAITYWLNNTLQTVDNDDENIDNSAAEIMANPTGVIKSGFYHKRRNSIQCYSHMHDDVGSTFAVPPSLPSSQVPNSTAGQKKKRRKSQNGFDLVMIYSGIDIKPVPKSKSQNEAIEENPVPVAAPPINQSRSKQTSPVKSSRASPQTTPRINQKEKFESSLDTEEEAPAFPCPNCDKHFKRSEHLKRHHRSVHSNIRPFHCKYCDKKFSRSDNLAQHLKTHYKTNSNGSTTIIYGNPNAHNRKKKDSSSLNS